MRQRRSLRHRCARICAIGRRRLPHIVSAWRSSSNEKVEKEMDFLPAYVSLAPLSGRQRSSTCPPCSRRYARRARRVVTASLVEEDQNGRGDFRLFNTLTEKKESFRGSANEDGVVRLYTCGPTVYDSAHIGNFRAFLTYDVLKRWLLYRDHEVKHVMNLTDIDDKIIKRVRKEGTTLSQLTRRYADLFFRDLSALNVIPADVYPRATGHINEIVELVEGLVEKGAAYERAGSTYFRVDAFKDYGKLVKLERRSAGAERMAASDADEYEKADARDFALWKAYKEEDGEIKWDTNLGTGRPGWHIECSCMAMKYLGPEIDIHGGGIDLVFPHHENEIAQSEAYSGKQFARFWVHNGFVNIGGEKMSKSLGNFRTLGDIVKNPDIARAFRYLVVSSQYRSTLNFTEDVLRSAKSTIKRLDSLRLRLRGAAEEFDQSRHDDGTCPSRSAAEVKADVQAMIAKARAGFTEAMNDDLNTPRASAAMFDLVKATGKLLKSGSLSKELASEIDRCLLDFDRVFGIFYDVPSSYFQSSATGDHDGDANNWDTAMSERLTQLLTERAEARKQKNFARADEIRDEIAKEGFVVKDTPAGAKLMKRE